ncbi:unnamed protein product [Victoria cruziana]
MSSHLYGGYGGSELSSLYSSRLSGSREIGDSYSESLLTASRYLSSDHLLSSDSRFSVLDKASLYSDGLKFPGSDIPGISSYSTRPLTPSLYSQSSWSALDGRTSLPPPGMEAAAVGLKRQNEALYHQNLLGTHNSIAQSEAMFSTNPLTKRPRFESASSLPIYPQRPGEKDCAHYMLTRTCKFGDKCKFDHPLWVPEGGIPDWKEIPFIPSDALPDRPGEPDCPYFLKTQKCKYGLRCKFNHPKDKLENPTSNVETVDKSVLPERPSEPACAYYMKTGNCKFGATCKFHHPKDHVVPAVDANPEETDAVAPLTVNSTEKADKPFIPVTPALLHNSKGLPIRPGEADCPFYLKTGSCKYGATCRFNHPDRNAATLTQAVISSPALGILNPVSATLPHATINPWLTQSAVTPSIYPQRPGQMECDYYMKTGECKFGERCKFHHPMDRTATSVAAIKSAQSSVKLTLAGLPRREGEIACAFYMKTGTCKFGVTCRFDHPPPGEAVAKAVATKGGGDEETSDAEEEDAE